MRLTPSSDGRLALGLWGTNGHQIHLALGQYPQLSLVAFGAMAPEAETALRESYPEARLCGTYEELLAVPGLAIVSLCSPRRADQADDAIAALEAGIHVYAEKPCAVDEAGLDRILAAAERSTAIFHEMAGTVCDQPYWAMRGLVEEGVLGEVVQVSAQKSYPFHAGRPLDEAIDGGLIAQAGVHALRFVEHVAGVRTTSIEAVATHLGDPRESSDLKMAATMMGRLENGGVFSVVANYLNPPGFGSWGNEMLRIFGTQGMLEATDGGKRTRLVVGEEDRGPIDVSTPGPDWLASVLAHASGGTPPLFDLETELHPTRMVLRAKANAENGR